MDLIPLHPKLVHLPIALSVMMPFIAGGISAAMRREWLPARAWVLVVVLQAVLPLSGLAAANSGEGDAERVEQVVPRTELDAWTTAFDAWRCGGAESVADVMRRVGAVWDETLARQQPAVWITHAGVIRAATLLAQGVRHIHRADQWPAHAPAFGQWQLADI